MRNLFKRLLSTTTQEDIKKFDKLIYRFIDINDKRLHEKFKESLKRKKECCEKCDEVKKIVNPKVTFRIEQD